MSMMNEIKHSFVPVLADTARVVGTVDMVMRLGGTAKGWWSMQHKTLAASASEYGYEKKISISNHEYAYKAGLDAISKSEIRGVWLNVLKKVVTGRKKRGEEREVDEDWAPFYRSRIPIRSNEIDEWKKDMGMELAYLVECSGLGRWPKRTISCVKWNKIVCAYYDICKAGNYIQDWEAREKDYVDEKQKEAGEEELVINVSRAECFMECPRKYYWRYVRNLVPEETPTALTFGTGVHEAIRAWYGPSEKSKRFADGSWKPGLDDDKAIAAFEECIPEGHDEMAAEVESKEYGKLLLKRYFDTYRKADRENILAVGGVEKEVEVGVELVGGGGE